MPPQALLVSRTFEGCAANALRLRALGAIPASLGRLGDTLHPPNPANSHASWAKDRSGKSLSFWRCDLCCRSGLVSPT